MTRIIGPPRSRRRQWTFLSCLAAAVTVGVFFIGGASAVHDLGVFQLDGDALTSQQSTPQANDDWDRVCHQVNKSDCGVSVDTTSNTTQTNTAVSWSNDCNNGSTTCIQTSAASTSDPQASIFTGGGSKDPIDINSWLWKDGVGGLPDKDNLVHAYAARYDVKGAGATTDCATGTTCDVIYFGLDRFDNSGDAQTGFWFLQNACGEGTAKSQGGTVFACSDPTPTSDPTDDFHRNGDLLVLSDFSNGGTTSTINVYEWNTTCTKAGQVLGNGNTCGDANLEFLKGSANANCATSGLAGDDFCGLVNPGTTTLPWSFTDKSGTANNGALNGEFYEAGVNLTPLGLGGECFASIVSETRSSTSTSATLKDFIIAPFAPCVATISTSPSQTTVNPTQHVHDTATVTGNKAGVFPSSPPNVQFYLCKYAVASTTSTCSTVAANAIAPTVALSAVSGSSPPKSTAVSPDVNCAAPAAGCATAPTGGVSFTLNPLAPGHYCFGASWGGDANYQGAISEDGSLSQECFDVGVIATSVATKQSWYPNDTATISSTGSASDNLAAGGTVVFTLYSDGSCGTTSGATVLYQQTKANVPAAAQHSVEVSTSNPGGGDGTVTSYSETTSYSDGANSSKGPRSWKVVYTPPSGDIAHTGSSSSCTTTAHTEQHTYNYSNDAG